jgi:hypothetical protein
MSGGEFHLLPPSLLGAIEMNFLIMRAKQDLARNGSRAADFHATAQLSAYGGFIL